MVYYKQKIPFFSRSRGPNMGKRRHKVRELKLAKQKEKLHKNKLRKSKIKAKALAPKA